MPLVCKIYIIVSVVVLLASIIAIFVYELRCKKRNVCSVCKGTGQEGYTYEPCKCHRCKGTGFYTKFKL